MPDMPLSLSGSWQCEAVQKSCIVNVMLGVTPRSAATCTWTSRMPKLRRQVHTKNLGEYAKKKPKLVQESRGSTENRSTASGRNCPNDRTPTESGSSTECHSPAESRSLTPDTRSQSIGASSDTLSRTLAHVEPHRRIVVLGARGIGKSSLVERFVDAKLSKRSAGTRAYRALSYHGTVFLCEIIDTEGQVAFSQLESQHAIGVHGYILVYSITSQESLDLVQTIHDKIVDYSGLSEIPAVIVGTRADLHANRQVASNDGQRFAERNKAAWIEASASCNEHVGESRGVSVC
ncbi:ras family-domain-containing protein [Mycena vitilis]|nr:ras family-domain-containing protein [Mycena vitilis]